MKYKEKYLSIRTQTGGGCIIGFFLKDQNNNLYVTKDNDGKFDYKTTIKNTKEYAEAEIISYLESFYKTYTFNPENRYIIGDNNIVYQIDISENKDKELIQINYDNVTVDNATIRLYNSLNYNYVILDFVHNYYIDPKTYKPTDMETAVKNINDINTKINKSYTVEESYDKKIYYYNKIPIEISLGIVFKFGKKANDVLLEDDLVKLKLQTLLNKQDITIADIVTLRNIINNPVIIKEKILVNKLYFEMPIFDNKHTNQIALFVFNKKNENIGFFLSLKIENIIKLSNVLVLEKFRSVINVKNEYDIKYCSNMMDKFINYIKNKKLNVIELSNVGGIGSCKCYLKIAHYNKWKIFIEGSETPSNYDDNYCDQYHNNNFILKYYN